jgi:hypothetical protein
MKRKTPTAIGLRHGLRSRRRSMNGTHTKSNAVIAGIMTMPKIAYGPRQYFSH